MEGKRIDDLLDLFQYYVSGEELRQKAQEAEALLDGAGAAGLEEDMRADDVRICRLLIVMRITFGKMKRGSCSLKRRWNRQEGKRGDR